MERCSIMFLNDNNMWSDVHKTKSKSKKSKYLDKDFSSKHVKSKSSTKLHKKHQHSKLKPHANTVSDYIGPERLTRQVGLFIKGKTTNSISRLEKIIPKEIKARAKQDLQQVLKLTNGVKSKRKHKKLITSTSPVNEFSSAHFSENTPLYICHKTGFASNSWKNKLQKSVGPPAACSVLASIRKSPQKVTPVERDQLLVSKVLLSKIYPFIKTVNRLIFPGTSNKDKIKNKLLQVKQLFSSSTHSSVKTSFYSNVSESLPNSVGIKSVNCSQNTVIEDFHLNPIFTGVSIENDIADIFPPANDVVRSREDYVNYNDLVTGNSSTYLSNDICNEISNQASSSSAGSSSLKLIPTSPTSDNSPVWKLQVSPAKFVLEADEMPKIYFRHKMF